VRKIQKGSEPESLRQWKRSHPRQRYTHLPPTERQSIRAACLEEQYGLCAYCCHGITLGNAHNEHVEAQDSAPNRTLDFSNIVASCNHSKQCGDAHKTQTLPLTSLMDECETELKFYLSGAVEGLTPRAASAIKVLNLGDTRKNNLALFSTRKAVIESLLFTHNIESSELSVESDEVLAILFEELQQPDEHNRLQPFAPVLVNVLRQLQR
jgi:uncharacterized protein (TIGR02646 family)